MIAHDIQSTQRTPVDISLVLATLGRRDELELLLASLAGQTFRSFELIVVDQSADDRLLDMLEHWKDRIAVSHLRAEPGLSRARNIGLAVASGALVAFPDDDCWYPRDLLAKVDEWFRTHTQVGLLCCIARDTAQRESTTRWPARSGYLDRSSVLRACSSPCLFLRRVIAIELGGFDELMGLGAHSPFQSAEDLDLALRVIGDGHACVFERGLQVYHPVRLPEDLPVARAFQYGMGFGYLLRKHRYMLLTCFYHALRAAGGMQVAALQGRKHRARFHWNSLRGRISGYFSAEPASTERMRETCRCDTAAGEKS